MKRPGPKAWRWQNNPGKIAPRGYNYIAVYFLSSELLLLESLLALPVLRSVPVPVLPWSGVVVLLPELDGLRYEPAPVPPTALGETPKCE